MLLRVLDSASGVCLVLGPKFPEVVHRGPSFNLSGVPSLSQVPNLLFYLGVCWVPSGEFFSPVVTGGT